MFYRLPDFDYVEQAGYSCAEIRSEVATVIIFFCLLYARRISQISRITSLEFSPWRLNF